MDRHSELEVKFRADNVGVGKFGDAVEALTEGLAVGDVNYEKVPGKDTYWTGGEAIIRHRLDHRTGHSTLTTKKRKMENSIVDRHEVDLPLAESVKGKDVTAFLKLNGLKPLFSIEKVSYIYTLEYDNYEVIIALYDVLQRGRSPDRYLEIEIEKTSEISEGRGRDVLKQWHTNLKKALKLGDPLNQSLYEMYKPSK